ncbi:hypothetical protein HDU77_000327 [Chytriomyces hyalinus]|nr:hypothetical protein HDU77_000327 [Chytriomyces hyalinus]
MNIHTDSTTLMLLFLMESVRRLEERQMEYVRRLEDTVRRAEERNDHLVRSLLQGTYHHHRTTIPTNTIPISSTIFTAPVDAAAAAPVKLE